MKSTIENQIERFTIGTFTDKLLLLLKLGFFYITRSKILKTVETESSHLQEVRLSLSL